ncbi:tyrosine-protein phosphatase [Microbacterium sp. zg.Y1090]|uniref:tyrosine-protein phosphatase n=1 Tax=Microbacterium wangruii TaxID=3049073 RepID=UPI00214CFCA9|nr:MULTISPECIES: tyrosine-protein phosphatase [unclassified Microbacterium]MCR2817683.1 tyrosine-protein phosphatase [Microbacterium sp. zg.Y1090]MDL5485674.1 tyrosine-protein phosphatase [Microbacterium sp. zg-Y1211]WIM28843.1 tyrosine-protein phosphatase [Microbacterium sp. zg-Y1090]
MIDRLEGTVNFRDAGGMPLRGGGSTAAGVLFRSDALGGLTADGLGQLAESDIEVIVDFRTPFEQQMAPDRLPASRAFHTVRLPLLEGALTGLAQQAMQMGRQSGDRGAAEQAIADALEQLPTLEEIYARMLEHGATAFAEAARTVAAPVEQSSGVLLHCTAGKDRTGVAMALILDTVGVERDAIVADYTASERNLSGAWADQMFSLVTGMGVPLTPALTTLIAGAPASAIEAALAWVDERGGSEAYLRAGGLSEDESAGLNARLRG